MPSAHSRHTSWDPWPPPHPSPPLVQITPEKVRLRRRAAEEVRRFTQQAVQRLRQGTEDGEFLQGEHWLALGGGAGLQVLSTQRLFCCMLTLAQGGFYRLVIARHVVTVSCPHAFRRQLGGSGALCGPVCSAGQVCAGQAPAGAVTGLAPLALIFLLQGPLPAEHRRGSWLWGSSLSQSRCRCITCGGRRAAARWQQRGLRPAAWSQHCVAAAAARGAGHV